MAVVALLLGGCATAVPTHFHSLLATVSGGGAPAGEVAGAVAIGMPFELLPVLVPAQVDQPQLVVRTGGEQLLPLEHERWIAPLADELRAALSQDLAQRLRVADISGQPQVGVPAVLRVKVDVRRFDSAPGRYAALEAVWSLSLSANRSGTLICRSSLREDAAPGYDELVHAHQRALAALAGQIAGTARAWLADSAAGCTGS
ncbi:MAG: membrane integrity-associated transporter subunit PqiC [Proteobacteria bacterium]|nr:membrane integrity-associated transporter subunit PqiC [Pseudomonadota bacterium]